MYMLKIVKLNTFFGHVRAYIKTLFLIFFRPVKDN